MNCAKRRTYLVLMAAMTCALTACSPSPELPPELPPLARPIPGPPPAPPKPAFDSIALQILNEEGAALDSLETNTTFRGKVTFRLAQDSPPVTRVLVQLGMYVKPGEFVTAWVKSGKVAKNAAGEYEVDVPLRAAPHEGTFYVRAESDDYVLIEREVAIKGP